jgi:hypothetical protein
LLYGRRRKRKRDDANEIVARANRCLLRRLRRPLEVRMIISDAQGGNSAGNYGASPQRCRRRRPAVPGSIQPTIGRTWNGISGRQAHRPTTTVAVPAGTGPGQTHLAGDKRTSFVGAHYFYEDVSGRRPTDDNHELVETTDQCHVLRHAEDAASVEFARLHDLDRQADFLPMKIEYLNPAGKEYRRVEVLEVQEIGGHPTVTTSRVMDLASGGQTDMQFRYIQYDLGIPDDIFTERSLRTPPREWLERPAD